MPNLTIYAAKLANMKCWHMYSNKKAAFLAVLYLQKFWSILISRVLNWVNMKWSGLIWNVDKITDNLTASIVKIYIIRKSVLYILLNILINPVRYHIVYKLHVKIFNHRLVCITYHNLIFVSLILLKIFMNLVRYKKF